MFLIRQVGLFVALLAGIATSQLPEFAQQYRQRLGGAIDELQRFINDFDRDAKTNGMSRAQGIETLRNNAEPLASQRGRRIRETEARLTRLRNQNIAFNNAGSFKRMAVMAKDFDPFIAERAYQSFEPALPLTSEGLVAAVTGFLAGLGLWNLFVWPIKRARRRRRKIRVSV